MTKIILSPKTETRNNFKSNKNKKPETNTGAENNQSHIYYTRNFYIIQIILSPKTETRNNFKSNKNKKPETNTAAENNQSHIYYTRNFSII